MCARAGLISIHYVNTTGHRPYVAPWGGFEARYSTNPYCTAIPATDKTPMIVLDMATSRVAQGKVRVRSEEHTSELQSLMRISYDVFCLKKNKIIMYTKVFYIIYQPNILDTYN